MAAYFIFFHLILHREKLDYIRETYGVRVHASTDIAVKGANVVIAAVKPQNMEGAMRTLKTVLNRETILISIVAG